MTATPRHRAGAPVRRRGWDRSDAPAVPSCAERSWPVGDVIFSDRERNRFIAEITVRDEVAKIVEVLPERLREGSFEHRKDLASEDDRVRIGLERAEVGADEIVVWNDVVVRPDDVIAARLVGAAIAGVGQTGLGFEDATDRKDRFVFRDHAFGLVGAAIVDDKELPVTRRRQIQAHDAAEKSIQRRGSVARANDQGRQHDRERFL